MSKTNLAVVRSGALAKQKLFANAHRFGSPAVGFGIGYAESKGKIMPRVVDSVPIPALGQAAIVTAIIGDMIGGKSKLYLSVAADSMGAIAGYQQGRAGLAGGAVHGR